jgi:phosphoribosylaminoimidazole-succinocarboxamide synthase
MFERLGEIGIPNHFIKRLNMREQLIYAVEIIPIEVIVRNYVAGSFAERFKAEEGEPIGGPLIEFCLKDDALGDPFIAEEHIYAFDLCDPMELEEIRLFTIRINDYLSGLFRGCGITLADMKLEFGRMYDENGFPQLMLADEISPDNCRLWDIKTGEKMDKDRFRRDLGDVSEYYREVATRLGISTGMNTIELVETDEEEATEKKKPVRKAPRKPAASRSKPKGKK